MDPSAPRPPAPPLPSSAEEAPSRRHRRRRRHRSASADLPRAYRVADALSGALLLTLVVFTPWAFGTTQAWSLQIAQALALALGAALVTKWVLRVAFGFTPPRWGTARTGRSESADPDAGTDLGTRVLAVLTILFLAYLATSAINARAVYDPALRQFDYDREPWRWLPFSYDREATWAALIQMVGLAAVFWGARDWLLFKTESSHSSSRERGAPEYPPGTSFLDLPPRLRTLLWVICLNGAALALVSIVQRADGTSKLLWLLPSRSAKTPDMVFGPWAYRGNAAQYFNLVWPVCLALWLWLQERASRSIRRAGRFDGPHLLLLPCAVAIAVCPMISSSRGGALISALAGVAVAVLVLTVSRRHFAPVLRWLTVGGLVIAGLAAVVGGWSALRHRLIRPDLTLPTPVSIGTNDFTVVLRLRVPHQFPKWQDLIRLTSSSRVSAAPGSFSIGLVSDGGSFAHITGSASTNTTWSMNAGALRDLSGSEVTLAAVRRDGLRLYLNGREIDARKWHIGVDPTFGAFVHSRYVFVMSEEVRGLAVLDFALTEAEIAALNEADLGTLNARGWTRTPVTLDGLSPAQVQVPDGARLERELLPSQPDTSWWALRRLEGTGPLFAAIPVERGETLLRSPADLSLRVRNPGAAPLHLAVSIDGGPRLLSEIGPRADTRVQVACRTPHGGPPRRMEWMVVDEDGVVVPDLPEGTQLLLSDVQLQPGGTVFSQRLDHEFRVLQVGDRLSGRSELWDNAQAMARDFTWWGSGAGTFSTMYQLYMKPGQEWAGYLHNDWLEFRITLGRVGFGLAVAALGVLFVRTWIGPGIPAHRLVAALVWVSLGTCLAHARFDFPFQIYSVLLLFVVLCSVVASLGTTRES